jgi:hypothetical protein
MALKGPRKRKNVLRDIKNKKFSKSVKEMIEKRSPKFIGGGEYAKSYGEHAAKRDKAENKSLTDTEKNRLKKTRSKSKGNLAKRVLEKVKKAKKKKDKK